MREGDTETRRQGDKETRRQGEYVFSLSPFLLLAFRAVERLADVFDQFRTGGAAQILLKPIQRIGHNIFVVQGLQTGFMGRL